MIIFKILLVAIILIEVFIGIMFKYNINGFKDLVTIYIKTVDLEDYMQNNFANKFLFNALTLLILVLLSIC